MRKLSNIKSVLEIVRNSTTTYDLVLTNEDIEESAERYTFSEYNKYIKEGINNISPSDYENPNSEYNGFYIRKKYLPFSGIKEFINNLYKKLEENNIDINNVDEIELVAGELASNIDECDLEICTVEIETNNDPTEHIQRRDEMIKELMNKYNMNYDKYAYFDYINENGEDCKITLRIADHSCNPLNNRDCREGDLTISIVIANFDPTLERFQTISRDNTLELRYDTDTDVDNIVCDIETEINNHCKFFDLKKV